jgi:membrane-bound acyltransferase YfiQ involved in biofilm formation
MMYLGNYSFGLFLIHIIYMYVGSELLTLLHMSPQQLCFYPLLFIIMLSLSLLTMEALAHVSWGHYFIGHVSRL